MTKTEVLFDFGIAAQDIEKFTGRINKI